MTPLFVAVTMTALIWLLAFALFIVALRRRWIARFRRGFLLSMTVALVGVGLMSASVVGVWGYQAGKRLLNRELTMELADVGGIVERRISGHVAEVSIELSGFGSTVASLVERHLTTGDIVERLSALRSFDPHFLQVELFDHEGRSLAVSAGAQAHEVAGRTPVAFGLDGNPFVSDAFKSAIYQRQLILVSVPIRVAGGPVKGVVVGWYDLQTDLSDLVTSAKFNESGYAVVVDGDGQIIAHPDPSRIDQDVSSYPAVRLARSTEQAGTVVALNARRENRLFGYRPMPNPATLAKHPWVLLTEINESEQLAPLVALERELAVGMLIVLLVGVVVAQQVSQSMDGPLRALGDFAHRIGSGDLTGHTSVSGQDVAGRLSVALNDMASGLRERDRVKEVFGRYIATQVSDKILSGEVDLGGDSRRVTVLFSDIRNFTSMSEKLTPTQVVSFLNDYFTEMVDAVFSQDGMLDKFMGDGLMAVFGAFGDKPDHPRRAVAAALRMKALLAKINGERAMAGKDPIAIGIGVHTDDVIVGNIGSRKRLEFTAIGDGVNVASRLQTLNKEFGTAILISETT
ncbi:MAG: adenylate/guanylate cyclase domain-containing protein, partial [Acidobacteriota bacterium]